MDNLFNSLLKIQASYPDIIETQRLILKKQVSSNLISVKFFVFLKNSTDKIGTIVMLYDGEILYDIDEPFRKNGYATESVLKLINISKRNYFYLSINSTNIPSIKTARKLGFNLQRADEISLIYEKEK